MKVKKILAIALAVSTMLFGSFTISASASVKNNNSMEIYHTPGNGKGNGHGNDKGNGNGNNGNGNAYGHDKGNGQGNGNNKGSDAGDDDTYDVGNGHNIKIHKHAQTIIKFDGEIINLKTINQGAKYLKDLKYEINVYDTSGNMMGDGTITINVGELLPKKVAKNALIFTNVAYIDFKVIATDEDGETYTTAQRVYNTELKN